jgi:hypothetical protein
MKGTLEIVSPAQTHTTSKIPFKQFADVNIVARNSTKKAFVGHVY